MQGFMCGGGTFGDYGARRKHVKSQAKKLGIFCAQRSLWVSNVLDICNQCPV